MHGKGCLKFAVDFDMELIFMCRIGGAPANIEGNNEEKKRKNFFTELTAHYV